MIYYILSRKPQRCSPVRDAGKQIHKVRRSLQVENTIILTAKIKSQKIIVENDTPKNTRKKKERMLLRKWGRNWECTYSVKTPIRLWLGKLCCCFDDALFAFIKKLSHKEKKRIRELLYLPPGRRETHRSRREGGWLDRVGGLIDPWEKSWCLELGSTWTGASGTMADPEIFQWFSLDLCRGHKMKSFLNEHSCLFVVR